MTFGCASTSEVRPDVGSNLSDPACEPEGLYAAALAWAARRPFGNGSAFTFVSSDSIAVAFDDEVRDALRQIPPALLSELQTRNQGRHLIGACLPTSPGVRVTSDAELRSLGTGPYFWEVFYERFPDSHGLVRLSRPAVSRDGQTAAIQADYHFGMAGLESYILVLKRGGDGEWRVAEEYRYLVG